LVTLIDTHSSYIEGSREVDILAFFLLVVAGLAIFGAAAAAFGSDSRDTIEDAHIRDLTRRTI
jgi:hypothetical protein